jgi:hypothetical protein
MLLVYRLKKQAWLINFIPGANIQNFSIHKYSVKIVTVTRFLMLGDR